LCAKGRLLRLGGSADGRSRLAANTSKTWRADGPFRRPWRCAPPLASTSDERSQLSKGIFPNAALELQIRGAVRIFIWPAKAPDLGPVCSIGGFLFITRPRQSVSIADRAARLQAAVFCASHVPKILQLYAEWYQDENLPIADRRAAGDRLLDRALGPAHAGCRCHAQPGNQADP
jgi:hypothetical protein